MHCVWVTAVAVYHCKLPAESSFAQVTYLESVTCKEITSMESNCSFWFEDRGDTDRKRMSKCQYRLAATSSQIVHGGTSLEGKLLMRMFDSHQHSCCIMDTHFWLSSDQTIKIISSWWDSTLFEVQPPVSHVVLRSQGSIDWIMSACLQNYVLRFHDWDYNYTPIFTQSM